VAGLEERRAAASHWTALLSNPYVYVRNASMYVWQMWNGKRSHVLEHALAKTILRILVPMHKIVSQHVALTESNGTNLPRRWYIHASFPLS